VASKPSWDRQEQGHGETTWGRPKAPTHGAAVGGPAKNPTVSSKATRNYPPCSVGRVSDSSPLRKGK
jgi:hypothetical protein